MGIALRYIQASQSSNLRSDEHHHHTDTLAAVALSSSIGAKLFRVKYANDLGVLGSLMTEWTQQVAKKGAIRKWPQHVKHEKIAQMALNYWLDDSCKTCKGKGKKPVEDAPQIMSDEVCAECGGTCIANVVCEKRDEKYIKDMIETLNDYVKQTSDQAMRRLSRNMDL